eukprot:CAMPEP_0172185772 /NCGR_PEP_ID=MMETSP1050-20130122/20360_1 /TAXON_ID=233186 /ORGANISM="Cryptomonas curvata, Strain CCAP979/52" /LENGTH=316 /DNA_ID=CAMNT_0012859805 /DNA_START=51 /DNA_END=1000 /DNA_ORIENTATION=+
MQRFSEIDDESLTEQLCDLVGFDHPFWLENSECQSNQVEDAAFGCEQQFIHIIGDVLDQSLEHDPPQPASLEYSFEGSWLFEGDNVQFSALYYLQRIARYTGVSAGCIVAGFHYLEQLKAKPTPITLTPRNMQRLLLVAVMTATKILEDHCPHISCWAEIGEIEISELKSLEIAFLFALDFNLVVSADTYSRITHDLLYFASLREAALCPWRLPHEEHQSAAPHAPAIQEETTTEPHAPSRCATPEPADREPHAPCSGGAGAAAAGAAAALALHYLRRGGVPEARPRAIATARAGVAGAAVVCAAGGGRGSRCAVT